MLIQEFSEYQLSDSKPSTVKRYLNQINLFLLIYSPVKAQYSDLEEYFGELAEQYSPQHLTVVKSSLIAYFNFLILQGERVDNPAKNIELKKVNRDVKHHLLLSTEELDMLLEERKERYQALKWRNKLLISLVRYQGLTNADLLQLTVDDIKGGELRIDAHSGMNGNTFKLEPIQIEYFYEWKSVRAEIAQKGVTKLFLNKRGYDITGDGITSVIDTLKPLFPEKRINNEVIRGSVIAEHLDKSKDVLASQKFARHKWASTTMKYRNEMEGYSKVIQEKHPYNFM